MSKHKLNFEDAKIGKDGYELLANGYHHFDWDNFYVVAYASRYPDTGYGPGTTSGSQAGANGSGDAASMTLDGGSFTAKSVELTAAYDSNLLVEITGYRNGDKIYDKQFNLTDTAPLDAQLNFKNVDEIIFTSVSGTHDPNLPYFGGQMVIDDLILGKVHLPEATPASLFVGANHHPANFGSMIHPSADLSHEGLHPIA